MAMDKRYVAINEKLDRILELLGERQARPGKDAKPLQLYTAEAAAEAAAVSSAAAPTFKKK